MLALVTEMFISACDIEESVGGETVCARILPATGSDIQWIKNMAAIAMSVGIFMVWIVRKEVKYEIHN